MMERICEIGEFEAAISSLKITTVFWYTLIIAVGHELGQDTSYYLDEMTATIFN